MQATEEIQVEMSPVCVVALDVLSQAWDVQGYSDYACTFAAVMVLRKKVFKFCYHDAALASLLTGLHSRIMPNRQQCINTIGSA